MKKSFLIIALAFSTVANYAQDLTSKKGEPMLPEANDWAISFNADPLFQFIGNAFRSDSIRNNAPGVSWLNGNQTIIGKKFIDEKSAYRVLVRLGFTNQSSKNTIADARATAPVYPNAPTVVEDKMKMKSTNITIGVGKEWRKGKTRLQGFYGADVMIWISSSSTKYTYGNDLSTSINQPINVDFGTDSSSANTTNFGSNRTYDTYGNLARVMSIKSGLTFGIGVRGFIGAEYFIFPKIAVGAEYGWGLGFETTGKGKKTVESIGMPSSGGNGVAVIGQQDTQTSGSSNFGFDTDLNQGIIFGFKPSNSGGTASLKVTFHF